MSLEELVELGIERTTKLHIRRSPGRVALARAVRKAHSCSSSEVTKEPVVEIQVAALLSTRLLRRQPGHLGDRNVAKESHFHIVPLAAFLFTVVGNGCRGQVPWQTLNPAWPNTWNLAVARQESTIGLDLSASVIAKT
jgi:hypothetical protein